MTTDNNPICNGPRRSTRSFQYRDRAAERRKGINKDYADHDDLVSAYQNAAAPVGGDGAAAARQQQIEESKFLGGDIEHTHLVKGLDYALLQKIRDDLTNAAEGEPMNEDDDADAEWVWRVKVARALPLPLSPVVSFSLFFCSLSPTPPPLSSLPHGRSSCIGGVAVLRLTLFRQPVVAIPFACVQAE